MLVQRAAAVAWGFTALNFLEPGLHREMGWTQHPSKLLPRLCLSPYVAPVEYFALSAWSYPSS